MQPNTVYNTLLGSGTTATNPFALANYASLATTNPAEYNLMSTNTSGFFTAKVPVSNLIHAYPQMSGLTITQAIAQSHFQEVAVTATHRYSNGLTLMASVPMGRSI